MHRINGLSPSGIAPQPVPQYVPQPASSVVAKHVPPSHPTCLIASSVLRSAFARSIRNPFSRLVPGALLDMQQKSVEPSLPTLLHILAHMPRQKPAGMGRGRTRGSFQPSCPRRRILMSLCSAKPRLHRFPCLILNGCGTHSLARHRRPWQSQARRLDHAWRHFRKLLHQLSSPSLDKPQAHRPCRGQHGAFRTAVNGMKTCRIDR